MNKREHDYQQTKKELRAALARLIANEPECLVLRERLRAGKVIKINNANVEKEACKSNQALRRHPDVQEEVKKAESERQFGKIDTQSPTGSVKDDPLFKHTQERLDKSIAARKKLEVDKLALKDELARKDEILKEHVSHLDEMLAALWNSIPPENVEARMDAVKKLADVIEVNFNKE